MSELGRVNICMCREWRSSRRSTTDVRVAAIAGYRYNDACDADG
jgi:hypothetical protein